MPTLKQYCLCVAVLSSCSASFAAAQLDATVSSSSSQTSNTASPATEEPGNSTMSSVLNALPNAIEAMPTLLPEESSRKIVPPQSETRDDSMVDEKHHKFRNSLQKRAGQINRWFGEDDPNRPATAKVRVMVDSSWNKYDEFEVKPRIRGRIKLPALEKKLSLVFGDDSLDDEIKNNVAITNNNPSGNPEKTFDSQRTKQDNNSVALRWSDWFKTRLFETDFDVGIRSGDDVYGRLKISRDWTLRDNFYTRAEQIYRYGSQSENYLRTNLEIRQQRPNKPFLSDQFNITYADDNKNAGVTWENRLFRQHSFFHDNTFSYGVYTGGHTDNNRSTVNNYGPFVSWRQPVLRDWFFVQSDINYFNDRDLDRDHNLSAFLRMEALF